MRIIAFSDLLMNVTSASLSSELLTLTINAESRSTIATYVYYRSQGEPDSVTGAEVVVIILKTIY